MAYLYNLVFLWFIDLASQAAAGDSIMDDELVRLKARLLVQLWSCKTAFPNVIKPTKQCLLH